MWRAVVLASAVTDVGHLYGAYAIVGPSAMWDVSMWRMEEWVNYGILWAGIGVKMAFLAGIGVGKAKRS